MESWYELIGQHGYIGIFLLLTLGIVGLPIPDEVLLAYLGYLTSIGTMVFSFTFLAAFLGSACGITINYFLGVKLGEPFLRKYGPRFFIKEHMIRRTNRLFDQYGSALLFICYFIPGVRHIAAYIAGITKFSYKRFALFAYTGATVWVLTFLGIGNRLGRNWEAISKYFSKYIWVVIFIVCVAAVGLAIYFYRRRHSRSSSI